MKSAAALAALGMLSSGTAMATDYSVGIVDLGSEVLGGGSALNLYAINASGVDLIQTYVLPFKDFTGHLSRPLTLALSPDHDFAYVAYSGPSQPILVGFKVTPRGLVYEWQEELQTADAGLQGTTLVAGYHYVQENTYPIGLWVHLVSQEGKDLLDDYSEGGAGGYTVSAHADLSKKLYYSCRSSAFNGDPSMVFVYRFGYNEDVWTYSTKPLAASKDPTFVQGVCN